MEHENSSNKTPSLIGPAITLLVIFFVEGLAHTEWRIPNPPAFLLTLVVYSGFSGGIASGLLSAVLSWSYFAYFFSIPGAVFHYNPENFKRVIIWGFATPAMAFMVGILKRRLLERELAAKTRSFILAKEQFAREEAERQTRKLTEAIQARDEFISLASHELKTPLTSLKLQAQLIKRKIQKKENPVSQEIMDNMIETFDRQLDRMTQLIENMLDLSKLNSKGTLPLNIESFDLLELVEEVVERSAGLLDSCQCKVEMLCKTSVQVNWDRFRIEQVIVNLLTNAMKYGPDKPIVISVSQEDEKAKIIVRDFGIGIAKINHDRIFGRFERAVSSSHVGGLGLGLYISKEIIDAHGGSITVESEVNNGSTFTVCIPRELGEVKCYTPTESYL